MNLIKLPDTHYIIVSDEAPQKGELGIRGGYIFLCNHSKDGDIGFKPEIEDVYCKQQTYFNEEFCKTIIYSTNPEHNLPNIDFSKLPIEKCFEIGCLNTIKIAEDLLKAHADFSTEGMSEYQNGRFNGITEGLNKMLLLVKDKQFSIQDMRDAYKEGATKIMQKHLGKDLDLESSFNDLIQSFNKTKWQVELEMEEGKWTRASEPMNMIPKITDNSVTVISIK